MTSTEIAVRDSATVAVTERDIVDGWVSVVRDVGNLADYIAETDFVPKPLRNRPAAVAACILTGRELGIGPMASLKSIHMVQGVPSLSAEYKRARALAAGHEIVIDESNASQCVIRGRRKDSDRWVTIKWTLDMARRAKLDSKDVWKQYPQRMLQARASSELCDLLFPDASLGLETTEVLQDGGALAVAEGAAIEAAAEEAVQPEQQVRRAARKPRLPNPSPAEPRTPQGAAPAASAPAGEDQLPPLPGEEETSSGPAGGLSANSTDAGPHETDYDTPGTATSGKGGQLTAIWTVLNEVFAFSKDEKEQARAVVEHIVGHKLTGGTTASLSFNEARTVLDTLSHWQQQAKDKGDEPRDYLIAVMVAQDNGEVPDGQ